MSTTKTIDDFIAFHYPEVYKKMQQEGVWTFQIFSPLSLDDLAEIKVNIITGQHPKELETHTIFFGIHDMTPSK